MKDKMQEGTMTNPETPPITGAAGGGEPPTTPPGDQPPTDLTHEQMVQGIIDARGGMPTAPEDAEVDMEKQALTERMFALESELMLQRTEKVVSAKLPDATEQQTFAIAKASIQGNVSDLIDAVIKAQKTAQEKDEKTEDLETLHVEGGASGKQSDDIGRGGLADLFENIADMYAKPT